MIDKMLCFSSNSPANPISGGASQWRKATCTLLATIPFLLPLQCATGAEQHPAFQLEMSEVDSLCRPLPQFYNSHLDDGDESGFIEDQFGQGIADHRIKFLKDDLGIYKKLDIFNDGSTHLVVLQDNSINDRPLTRYTELLVMDAGSSLTGHIDFRQPDVKFWVDFGKSGSSIDWYQKRHKSTYLLTKDPNLAELLEEKKRRPFDISIFMPLIGSGVQRLISFNGSTFVVARMLVDHPIIKDLENEILLYQLDHFGKVQDRCYMTLK